MTEETSDKQTPMPSPRHCKEERQAALVVEKLTECQGKLFAYIYSVTADADLAKDILQETNRQLWQRTKEYDPGRDFLPWAITHAYNQVRTFRARKKRDRLVFEEEETLIAVTERYSEREGRAGSDPTGSGARELALEACMKRLSDNHRSLIDRFYHRGESHEEIAAGMKRRANTIAVMIHRIRRTLADCINRKLTHES